MPIAQRHGAAEWVPAGVSQVAQMLLRMPRVEAPDAATDFIQRLLFDERMKVVWAEFDKQRRP